MQTEKLRGFFPVKRTADLFGVDPFTVQRWIWAGKIRPLRKGQLWLIPAIEVRRGFESRKEVRSMPTKRELERRIEELEDKLEEARDLIDEALSLGKGTGVASCNHTGNLSLSSLVSFER